MNGTITLILISRGSRNICAWSRYRATASRLSFPSLKGLHVQPNFVGWVWFEMNNTSVLKDTFNTNHMREWVLKFPLKCRLHFILAVQSYHRLLPQISAGWSSKTHVTCVFNFCSVALRLLLLPTALQLHSKAFVYLFIINFLLCTAVNLEGIQTKSCGQWLIA